MKKSFKISLIIAVFAVISLFATTAYASDHVRSTYVQAYNGTTYTCTNTQHLSTIRLRDVKAIPASPVANGTIYTFAIYNDKIYYITGVKGSDNVIGSIYCCNLDGSETKLIANDAQAKPSFFLSEGCLFYMVFDDYSNYYGGNLNGGIMRVDLSNNSRIKIITDSNAVLSNVLEDKIFYTVGTGSHLMTTKGAYVGGLAPRDVEIASDVIVGATVYQAYLGDVYAHDWSWNKRLVCKYPDYIDGYKVNTYFGRVINETGGYVYFLATYSPQTKYTAANTALLRVPLGGNDVEVVATWYVS